MMYVDKARNATVNIGDRDLKTDVSSYQYQFILDMVNIADSVLITFTYEIYESLRYRHLPATSKTPSKHIPDTPRASAKTPPRDPSDIPQRSHRHLTRQPSGPPYSSLAVVF